ncbi:hypothetical protein HAX54_029528 [Datura stramonium]|uniref:Uncharacterized protein n=1 Tax=Datura stramonium TaxID=4076 RepID=A0ABS8V8Y0_DATST|nr:hypothetical protein [Datura stramonium]
MCRSRCRGRGATRHSLHLAFASASCSLDDVLMRSPLQAFSFADLDNDDEEEDVAMGAMQIDGDDEEEDDDN